MPSQQRDSANDSNLSRETQLYTVGSLLVTLFGVVVLVGFAAFSPFVSLGVGLGGAAVALGTVHLRRALSATTSEGAESQSAPAPDGGESASGRNPVTILKERYAQGDIDDGEFERRVGRLLEVDSSESDESQHSRRDEAPMRER